MVFKKGENGGKLGTHHTTEAKFKMRLAHLGKTTWNKGKKMSEEKKQKQNVAPMVLKPLTNHLRDVKGIT